MHAVACLLDNDVDADRLLQVDAIVIDEALGFKAPVIPFGERLAQLRFRYFEQAIEAGEHFRPAVFRRQLIEASFAEPVGAELPADVAEHELGCTAVGADDAIDVADRLEAALIAHRRKMQTLVEGLARLAGAASRNGS